MSEQMAGRDYHSKPWAPGDTFRADNGTQIPLAAGLFVYSGFGWGNYYSKTGVTMWLKADEASFKATEEGVKFVWRDGLKG